jgi:phage regulator Rha-like protein
MKNLDAYNYIEYLNTEFKKREWCPDNIFERNRKPKSELIRFGFYFFIDKYYVMSSYKIGKLVNRDHSAILNGIKKYNQWINHPYTFGDIQDRKWFSELYLDFIEVSSKFFNNEC